ncbi:MAG: outer membrane beta-barrel family protein [Muribaculaceae bacterium]|nr:outer membrane beta-barrel family protein [Muribaculaceae bacterium]
MKRLLLPLAAIIITLFPVFADNYFYLSGRVKESFAKTDLTKAYVITYDSLGNPKDSIRCNRGATFRDGEVIEQSYFNFTVPRCDSTYVFDVVCEGYTPQTITYKVEKVGKREQSRTIPTIFMERAPLKLNEVTVTASKIKFYNKGDTIVFNADAFQLAEGSMLDALVAQLPGVELKEGGVITFNGEQVESLLLNGKEFLDGNNNLMLQNIGAYTVKNIEVYQGQTEKEKWDNDPTAQKHLTMDVKLKKEYNQGWILNAQGGYGTGDRYTGRLFASWFRPLFSLTLLGNINNLNDNREPGKNDSWRPESLPSGTRRYKMGAVNYDYHNADESTRGWGHASIEHTATDNVRTTARTNFLQGGDTYDNSYGSSRQRELKFDTRHNFRHRTDQYWVAGMLVGRYGRRDNGSQSISATFNEEQKDITLKAIEAIYSDGSPEQLNAVINRSITRSDAARRDGEFQAFPNVAWKIPRTSYRLTWEPGIKYKTQKEDTWNDYTINYGTDPVPAHRKRQFTDNSPNHELTLMNNLTFFFNVRNVYFTINYEYRFFDRARDKSQYALDRLDDLGIYGTLPAGWLSTFDPDNSYTSRLIENTHSLMPRLSWNTSFKNMDGLIVVLSPTVSLKHSHLNYTRSGLNYMLKDNYLLVRTGRWDTWAEYQFKIHDTKSRRRTYTHTLRYNWEIQNKTPNMIDMIDVVDDSNPLNIIEGNPNLRTQYSHKHNMLWYFSPKRDAHPLNNNLTLSYNFTTNELVRGYTYDTSTGVRHTRTYNVDGNHDVTLSEHFNLQFGKKEQFSITPSVSATFGQYADMIGVNLSYPEQFTVSNRIVNGSLRLGWQIGKQNLEVQGSYLNRHNQSAREDFNDIDAHHFTYGLIGQFQLPYGLGISTDFKVYSRRGYGVKELDTNDAIWNLRLSWVPPTAKRWTFMIDGFDMLHQLTNVSYAVSATGRTVSYTNALPRYILFSAQYRLNIQPKKR